MTSPVWQGICVGGYYPLISRIVDNKETYITFVDNYVPIYKRFGIKRWEMMVVMSKAMSSDVLAGTEKYKYIDE